MLSDQFWSGIGIGTALATATLLLVYWMLSNSLRMKACRATGKRG
jgi:hypothetical protein